MNEITFASLSSLQQEMLTYNLDKSMIRSLVKKICTTMTSFPDALLQQMLVMFPLLIIVHRGKLTTMSSSPLLRLRRPPMRCNLRPCEKSKRRTDTSQSLRRTHCTSRTTSNQSIRTWVRSSPLRLLSLFKTSKSWRPVSLRRRCMRNLHISLCPLGKG